LKKNPPQKRVGRVVEGVDLEFKPQYCKTKTKQNIILQKYIPQIAQNMGKLMAKLQLQQLVSGSFTLR
jgi:glutamine amidotransferase-like uncharacterized protein